MVKKTKPGRNLRGRAEKEFAKKKVAAIAVERVIDVLVKDGYRCVVVSTPLQAKNAGFGRWPGFDIYAVKGNIEKYIEVKGRARKGGVRITKNEWRAAGEYRGSYYLYIVYNCFSCPRILYVRNPVKKLPVHRRRDKLMAMDGDIERVGKYLR